MARLFMGFISSKVFVMLSVAICIMLATGAPLVQIRSVDRGTCERGGWIFIELTNIQQAIHRSDPSVTQFNNYTLELCKIVTSYYLVESLTDDNSSSLLSSLKKSANDTIEFWQTTDDCSDNCSNMSLEDFVHRCLNAIVHNLLDTDPRAFLCESY